MNASVLVEKIARREGLVTVWDLPDVLLEMRRSKDLAYVFPSSGTPVIDDAVGLVAGAKHPREARELIEWIGSPEAQLAGRAERLPPSRAHGPSRREICPTGRATSKRR